MDAHGIRIIDEGLGEELDQLAHGLFQLLEEGLDGRRELSALAEPVIDALAVDLDVGGVLLRVVVADLLHDGRARRLQRVGDDDAVERCMGRAATAQANLEHLTETPSFKGAEYYWNAGRNSNTNPAIPASGAPKAAAVT